MNLSLVPIRHDVPHALRRNFPVLYCVILLVTVSACTSVVPTQSSPSSVGAAFTTPDAARLPLAPRPSNPPPTTVDATQVTPNSSSKKQLPPVAGVQQAATGPVLKCWQDGRLIVETRIQ